MSNQKGFGKICSKKMSNTTKNKPLQLLANLPQKYWNPHQVDRATLGLGATCSPEFFCTTTCMCLKSLKIFPNIAMLSEPPL